MSKRLSLFRSSTSQSSGKPSPHERFQSIPNKSYHEKFFKTCIDEILSLAVFRGTNRSGKVLEFRGPDDMEKMIDLKLKEESDSDEKLLELVRHVIKYSVKVGHPFFLSQLYSGVDPYGLIGQWLTDALNPSLNTYEECPVFTVIEALVLEELRRIVGFKKGDGIFCPGGSLANAFGISCARFICSPDIKVCALKKNESAEQQIFFSVAVSAACLASYYSHRKRLIIQLRKWLHLWVLDRTMCTISQLTAEGNYR